MVRRSFTAVLERNSTFTSDFATEPYEAAWASEARLFVRVLGLSGKGVELKVSAEVSPDGLFWCEEGGPPLSIRQPGLYSAAYRNFGHWLRFQGKLAGEQASVQVLIYLALKE